MLEDDVLISLVAEGDLSQLGVLYERHSDMVKRALRRTAPEMSIAEAEDLTKDVFLLLADKAANYEKRTRAKAYLYGIAVKKAFAWRRKTLLRRMLLTRETAEREIVKNVSETTQSDQLAMKEAVYQALSRLPAKQRDVLLLHTVEGFSGDEVAELLKISSETVRTRLFRARQTLLSSVYKNDWMNVLRQEAS